MFNKPPCNDKFDFDFEFEMAADLEICDMCGCDLPADYEGVICEACCDKLDEEFEESELAFLNSMPDEVFDMIDTLEDGDVLQIQVFGIKVG